MKTKKKKSRTKYDIAYTCMLVIAILIILGTGTYAYYRSTMTGTTSGTIAKWSFTANDQNSNFNINIGSLYPGKTGVYNLELSAENSDLDIYYEFVFDTPIKQSFARHLYFDSNYQIGLFPFDEIIGKYGIIPAGEKVTIPLYFNWNYNYDDYESYADGTAQTSSITVVGRQYTGNNGAIPLDILGFNDFQSINDESGYIVRVPE